jgi:hypothetical protein
MAQDVETAGVNPVAVEAHAGSTGFIDEELFEQDHTITGGSLRIGVSPRLTLGPEISYMVGPGSDRDLFVLGSLWVDLARPRRPVPAVTPYLVVGAGVMRHSESFAGRGAYEDFSCWGFAFSGGGGVRVRIGDRWYVAPEVRMGWEPHVRFTVSAGYRFGR